MSKKLSLKQQKANSIVKITGCIFNYNNAYTFFLLLWALNGLHAYPV